MWYSSAAVLLSTPLLVLCVLPFLMLRFRGKRAFILPVNCSKFAITFSEKVPWLSYGMLAAFYFARYGLLRVGTIPRFDLMILLT